MSDETARFDEPLTVGVRSRIIYRVRGLGNLMVMGHCAPAVMKTILDIQRTEADWLIRLAAGMPGGIGNTGAECGGITSPLVMLGLRYGREAGPDGLPLVFHKGHDHCRRFLRRNGTLLCREIRGPRERLLPCVMAVRSSPVLYAEAVSGDGGDAMSEGKKDAFRRLYSHMAGRGFHCAHSVLGPLAGLIPVGPELLDGTAGFMGGMLFMGGTCCALTAGIMALGLKNAEIEKSLPRVLRMIALMLAKGDAFADKINKFNVIMNAGNSLSLWFSGEFGSTQCRDIVRSDFSTPEGARDYMAREGVTPCGALAAKVAERVGNILEAGI